MRHVILEVFHQRDEEMPEAEPVLTLPLSALEAEKRAEYERGFDAGLAEAESLRAQDMQQGCRLLAQWQEGERAHFVRIRSDLLEQMRPLFEALIATVLPTAAKLSLLPLAVEHLLTRIGSKMPQSLCLALHPEDFEAIAPFLGDPSIEVVKDDSLLPGRYGLRFEEIEATFDIARLCSEVTELIRAFFVIEPDLPPTREEPEHDRD